MDAMSPMDVGTDAEDARTIGGKGVRRGRVEIITRGDRRRTWTLEQKRDIVAESLGRELTPTEVARKHAISSGLLYTWRQQILGGQISVVTGSKAGFARVELAPAPQQPNSGEAVSAALVPTPLAPPSPRPEGLIEIVLPGGVSVRVDAEVDGRALRRVLSALDGR
jgi:transposase